MSARKLQSRILIHQLTSSQKRSCDRNIHATKPQRAVTITYMAKDLPLNINGTDVISKGIYTSRLNFFGSGRASFNSTAPGNTFTVSRPTLVVEEGDTIDG
ncbi:hypothetical protein [Okeania sp.]|uniref:hypothetical protein n=1 Tax=Okeania sp. TaxID=3100323 RepID=UPI002B4B6B4E|nr:hypothetical protein [Okeania sp.]MEB3340617.1 hypothetical protein [Okeania sp.]